MWHTCRMCGATSTGLFKYATRAYACARCGLKKHGAKFLQMLPAHVLRSRFPAVAAEDFGLLDELKKLAGVNDG